MSLHSTSTDNFNWSLSQSFLPFFLLTWQKVATVIPKWAVFSGLQLMHTHEGAGDQEP